MARLAPVRTGRGFGLYHALTGAAALPAGVLFGWLYQTAGGPLALRASALGMIAAVHTSFFDRNTLKSRTSRLFLPSRKRTLIAFADVVVLTTDKSELNAFPEVSLLTV